MEPETGGVHIFWHVCRVKQGKDLAQAFQVGLLHSFALIVLIERRQSFMANVGTYPLCPGRVRRLSPGD